MWASRPLRADSSLAQRPASDSYYPEELPAASSPTGGGGSLWRQASNAPGSAGPRWAGWGCSGLCNTGVVRCSVQPGRPAARHSCVPDTCVECHAAAGSLLPLHLPHPPLPAAPRTRAPIAAPLAQLAVEGWAARTHTMRVGAGVAATCLIAGQLCALNDRRAAAVSMVMVRYKHFSNPS